MIKEQVNNFGNSSNNNHTWVPRTKEGNLADASRWLKARNQTVRDRLGKEKYSLVETSTPATF